jgi:predicted permease
MTRRRERTPPPFTLWLLTRALGNADEAQNIIGDLHEEWRTRHTTSPAEADGWFRREARNVAASWLRLRLVRSRRRIPMHQRSSVGDSVVRDTAYAVRSLRKGWRFAAGVVLSLGLAVGLGIPVLGLADHFFLRPPPGIADPDRVMRLVLRGNNRNGPYFTDGVTGLDYRAMATQAQSVIGVAAWINLGRSLGRGADARTINVTLTTASFFRVLGVRPVLGRTYTEAEDVDGVSEPPCVVTYQFWKSAMNGAADALGKRLVIGAVTYTVVGVAPEGFSGMGLGAVDAFLPIHVGTPEFQGRDPELWTTDRSAWLRIVARLKPGVSLASATADVERVYRLAGERTRDRELAGTILWDPVQPGRSKLGNRAAKTALWLSAGGVLLLVLVTANLVSLFLARTAAQRQQLAIRLALGGAWKHLLRLHLIEATILGVLAAMLGVTVSVPAIRAARALILPAVTWARPAIDLRVGAAAFVLAAGIGAIVALWSSLQAIRLDPADLLRSGAGHATASRRTHRVRQSLLMVQAAIFAALLCGAFAFVMSLRRASAVDFGFDMDRLMSASIPLPGDSPRDQIRAVYQRALERVSALPEVESASLGYMEPWYNNTEADVFVPGASVKTPPRMMFDLASPGHLRTFGTTMRAGRWIDSTDVAGAAPVLVVNEALERAYWPNESAIGHCMRIGADTMPCRTIVGVVRDARVGSGSIDGPYEAVYYIPIAQSAAYRQVPHLFFRPRGDAVVAQRVVRRLLQELEPNLPAVNVHPVKANVSWLTAQLSVGAAAFAAFGILAAIVATIGLYSVLSFLVVEQRRETALRLALGAMPRDLGWSVARRAMTIVLGGMAIGFAALIPLRTLLEPMLFHTKLLDGWSLAIVAIIGATTAALGALVPTRAILRTDAAGVLRE